MVLIHVGIHCNILMLILHFKDGKIMEKICCLFVLILTLLLFTSCSLGEINMKNHFSQIDPQATNNKFEEIISAIQNQNEPALKDLFSKTSISQAEDIHSSITALFDFFQGEMLSYDDLGARSIDKGKNDDGTRRIWESIQSTYDVETTEQKYRFAIKEFTKDTADPNNVGIYSLYIIREEDSNLQFAYWGDGQWSPGIIIQ